MVLSLNLGSKVLNVRLGKCDTCDSGKKVPVIVYHVQGSNALNQCRHCDPGGFEERAREDINSWLRGDIPTPESEYSYG